MTDSLSYALDRTEHKQYVIEKALDCLCVLNLSLKESAEKLSRDGIFSWQGKPYSKHSLYYLLRSEGIKVEDVKREYILETI